MSRYYDLLLKLTHAKQAVFEIEQEIEELKEKMGDDFVYG